MKEAKAGIDSCVETIQEERLANYVVKGLDEKKQSLHNKDYFAIPNIT